MEPRAGTGHWLLLAMVFAAATSSAAPPVVPTSLPYQGLLLDGLGAPRTGSVDLTVRIFDAVVGGTLVYKQSFPGVALADGVFTVQLGPSGDATDAPANPLTTSLATALAGDVGATAPVRFLEMTVNAEGALARTQILSSAYAVRATSAAAADTATTATTATNATQVGGLSADYVTQLLTWLDADGGNPPNTDPLEGTADVDGDGRANFIDSDNDGDGLSDTAELAQGTHIDLVTPTLGSVTPNFAYATLASPVTLAGTSFQAGMTVAFGTQNPTPTVSSSTSAQVTVGPQAPGAKNVRVTLANGQTALATNAFTFTAGPAHMIPVPPGFAPYSIAVRDGTTQIAVGGNDVYALGDAMTGAFTTFPFASRTTSGVVAVALDASGRVAGIRCRDLGATCAVELALDSDGDDALDDEVPVVLETLAGTSPSIIAAGLVQRVGGGWAAYYQRYTGPVLSEGRLAYDRNADGDFADPNELVTVPPGGGHSFPGPGSVAIDSTGRVACVGGGATQTIVYWDRNGDGDFGDVVGGNPETITILPTGAVAASLGLAFDTADRLLVAEADSGTSRLYYDRNGDGDFADANETASFSGTRADVAIRAGQPLAFATATASPSQVLLRTDGNADGDFADAGELVTLPTAPSDSSGLAMVLNGSGKAIAIMSGAIAVGDAN
jgi:hypothetical protein